MKKDNIKNNSDSIEFFDMYSYYEKAKNSNTIINFEKLIATVLFKNKIGFESEAYNLFVSNIIDTKKNREDFIFENFVISFDVQQKFALDALVPSLKANESNYVNAFDLTKSDEKELNEFLKTYNETINEWLLKSWFVEIMPGIIMYISKNTNKYKLLFSKNWISKINNAIN
ncbi:Protein of uncharacterised function (DUF2714) [Mycoplasmopsis maculosa]|uniref:Protein of uncharacterized function (DUF2714) n=1 Tax=Mycoplasmopsis maculosa TaxID=114885 RepID=A0A449B556_9BACT|nr:DUF2714 domain-containing protein [Mycoplasmopsis maculosa]VEU75722.1 Protein of uncharacterised function (DUF2714) [Mycoplasmopsis maculosa]